MAEASSPADAEEIPSDFFDDFNKAEFIESLSVIDSWDESGGRPGAAEQAPPRRSGSADLDRYIQPGSRRNPDKTNEAIRRDKDRKVKEYLQKSLEQDILPPGTELDDFLDDTKSKHKTEAKERRKSVERPEREHFRDSKPPRSSEQDRPREDEYHKSLDRQERDRHREFERHRSPFRDRPRDSNVWQHREYRDRDTRFVRGREERSPGRRHSPFRRSPNSYHRFVRRQYSPPRRHSPGRHHFERRYSPRRSPHRRSPPPRTMYRSTQPPGHAPVEYGGGYYPPGELIHQEYSAPNGAPYGYPPGPVGIPAGPVGIAPVPAGIPPPLYPSSMQVPAPMPVPAPIQVLPTQDTCSQLVPSSTATKTPYDALAQLYAEGKISKEDYLKLAPNKDAQVISSELETSLWKEKHELIKRCNTAQGKLLPLRLPTCLVIHNQLPGPEKKSLPQRFASPLKRLAPVEFAFTSSRAPSFEQHNKKTLDLIVAAVGLDDVVPRSRKRAKGTQDVACQTTRPFCAACDVRDATERCDAATLVDVTHFSTSAHTQVVEADLVSSRAVFAPSGGVADTMSIAHLTPAQLVSQLAARAKTLKDAPGSSQQHQHQQHPHLQHQQQHLQHQQHQQQQYMRRDYYDRGHGYNYRY